MSLRISALATSTSPWTWGMKGKWGRGNSWASWRIRAEMVNKIKGVAALSSGKCTSFSLCAAVSQWLGSAGGFSCCFGSLLRQNAGLLPEPRCYFSHFIFAKKKKGGSHSHRHQNGPWGLPSPLPRPPARGWPQPALRAPFVSEPARPSWRPGLRLGNNPSRSTFLKSCILHTAWMLIGRPRRWQERIYHIQTHLTEKQNSNIILTSCGRKRRQKTAWGAREGYQQREERSSCWEHACCRRREPRCRLAAIAGWKSAWDAFWLLIQVSVIITHTGGGHSVVCKGEGLLPGAFLKKGLVIRSFWFHLSIALGDS